MMLRSERSRITFVEAHAKREKWRTVALVGVKNTSLVRQFIANFIACKILVVPVWQEDLRPAEAAQQRNAQRNLRVWSKCYTKRFWLDDGDPVKAIGRAAREFDAVILWDGIAVAELPRIGAAWAPWVRSGGWLLGVDHRLADVRRILDEVAPSGWEDFREGIWGVRVRRPHEDVEILPVGDLEATIGVDVEGAAGEFAEPTPHISVDAEAPAKQPSTPSLPAGGEIETAGEVAAMPYAPQSGDNLVAGRQDMGVRAVGVDKVAVRRPRRTRTGDKPSTTPTVGDAQSHVAQPTPKRRGRPPGSKNKAVA